MQKTAQEQEKRNTRISRLVDGALRLTDEDQIYVLGLTEGMITQKSLAEKRPKKEEGSMKR